MSNNELPQRMTIGEAAKYIGVSRLTLKRWEKKGKIKSDRINERGDRRYRAEDVQKLIKKYD